MPHLAIECSPRLCEVIDCNDLLAFAHYNVASLGVFRLPALRSRIFIEGKWLVGEGEKGKEAVHIRLQAKKRPVAVKSLVLKELYEAMRLYLEERLQGTGVECMLSVEIVDFDEFYMS